jgi:dTDP-4-amino-4,6-dideoxygalactose transaminase
MPVPLLDINRQHAPLIDDLKAVFAKALDTSRFIKGPEMEQFEAEFADYCGTSRAVGCASGTDALILSLQAVGVVPGDLVITSPFTFFASAGAIVRTGGVPLFVDILPDTFNMDPSCLSSFLESNCAITERGAIHRPSGGRIAAVMPVHLFGQTADMEKINSTCEGWELPVIEDACQAVGARWMNKKAGNLGTTGCFSFFPSKNLGALGDAGCVTTSNEQIASSLVRLREHGGQGYLHSEVGTNSRLDAIQAGFLRVKLRHLDGWHEGRRKNAGYYAEALGDLEEVQMPVIDDRARSVYNQFTIQAENRDGLLEHLRGRGIGCAVYYPLPLHLQECFSWLGYVKGDFPVSERSSDRVISLPVFGELTEAEIEQVVTAIRDFYES